MLTERSVSGFFYKRTTKMDREGFAKVSRWCRESIVFFSGETFNVIQLSYYGCYIMRGRCRKSMIVTYCFCQRCAKLPRELRESRGWDLKRGALSFSQLPHFHTYSLSLSFTLSLSLLLSLSQSVTISLCHSLAVSLSLSS